MFHYVYRISNKIENKHYYGVRSSKDSPVDDLGIKYFSSALDKVFKKDQKENPQNYKYKVVKKFSSRKEAMAYEIKLHNKFDVAVSEAFYNRSKSTSLGFDRSGCKAPNFGKKHSEETRKKISESNSKDWLVKRNNIITGMSNKKHSEKTKRLMSEKSKGKPKSEEHKLSMKKPKSEEHIEKLKNCKKFTKIITLYNKLGKEVSKFESITLFRKYCSENFLPYKKFMDSYYFNNSEPIGNIKQNNKRKYNGWFIK